jgi:hypothetical protein
MFTKDISLEDCILDLVDNSIDGLIRTKPVHLSDISQSIFRTNGRHRTNAASLPLIEIEYSAHQVVINDRCGGIDWNYALNGAFNFGHGLDEPPSGYLGVYGIGLKRALFKIGDSFHIESRTLKSGFTCDLNVREWLAQDSSLDDWKIPLQPTSGARTPNSAGTSIRITNLHDEVKIRLGDVTFGSTLFEAIRRTYSFFLDQYVRVKVNGSRVDPFDMPVGKPKEGQASYETFERDGVKVLILATIARGDERGRLTSDTAGWYIVCNGRVVLAADKSEKSGWNMTPMPQFHSKYTPFIGLVFFESQDPLKLPWTTTKRDLNKESAVYLHTKGRMAAAARPIISFCNRKYGTDVDTEPVERDISKRVASASLGSLLSDSSTVFNAVSTEQSKPKTTTRVQYDADNSDLDKIRKHLRRLHMGASAIGKHTFGYFLKQEGLR